MARSFTVHIWAWKGSPYHTFAMYVFTKKSLWVTILCTYPFHSRYAGRFGRKQVTSVRSTQVGVCRVSILGMTFMIWGIYLVRFFKVGQPNP